MVWFMDDNMKIKQIVKKRLMHVTELDYFKQQILVQESNKGENLAFSNLIHNANKTSRKRKEKKAHHRATFSILRKFRTILFAFSP